MPMKWVWGNWVRRAETGVVTVAVLQAMMTVLQLWLTSQDEMVVVRWRTKLLGLVP